MFVLTVRGKPSYVRKDQGQARAKRGKGESFWQRWLGNFAVPAKFCVVGVMNALVDFGTLNLLLWSCPDADPLSLALYNTLALILANVNSYLLNTRWTFREQACHDDSRQRVRFGAQALLNVGVNNGLLWLTAGVLADAGLSLTVAQNMAKVISTLGASALGFLVMRYLVFKPRRRTQRSAGGGLRTRNAQPNRSFIQTASAP